MQNSHVGVGVGETSEPGDLPMLILFNQLNHDGYYYPRIALLHGLSPSPSVMI